LFAFEADPLWRSQILELSEFLLREVIIGAFGELVRVVLAAAVVGGVVGPVPAARALPGDCDADVDAEQSGEQSGGEFGGEGEQCAGAILAGSKAELAQSFAEVLGADRPTGPAAGEQPWGGSLVAEGGVAVAGCDELKDEEWAGTRLP
jgi:hypothetical protein